MATRTSQRIGIWIIAVVMFFGTLGAFFLPILMNDNAAKEAEQLQALQAQYEQQATQQATKQAEPLDGYTAEPFARDGVTELKVEELKAGDGTAATPESTLNVNYFGWTSDGTIFDSSKRGGTTTPIDLSLNGVIAGWTEGLTGAKPGSVRKLTIPAAKAYGEAGSPPSIGSNEPLVFIVEVKSVK